LEPVVIIIFTVGLKIDGDEIYYRWPLSSSKGKTDNEKDFRPSDNKLSMVMDQRKKNKNPNTRYN
jgi:hypothetical protein